MLWIKSLHIIAVLVWFAGLFCLPRLFVHHASAGDAASIERFKAMERRLYYGVMAPSAVASVVLGGWLTMSYGIGLGQHWLLAKIALVVALIVYHLYCGMLLEDLAHGRHTPPHNWFRWLDRFPALAVAGAVLLVVLKPF